MILVDNLDNVCNDVDKIKQLAKQHQNIRNKGKDICRVVSMQININDMKNENSDL